jgi:large subunit ribosomal protein L9
MIKVLLRRNVPKLGQIGEVVEVRDGYARNYLIPQGLALAPTESNLKAIEAERQAYLAELARQRTALEQRAKLLDSKEFTIIARANEEGVLYGSVGPAQIAAAVTQEGFLVDPENIALDEPIRRLDKYEVPVRFDDDVRATIVVWVVPLREPDEAPDAAAPGEQADASEQPAGEENP